MKQMEVTEKQIGENLFYIKKFPAFTASGIFGELSALLAPFITGLVALLGGSENNGDTEAGESGDISLMDLDVEAALPALNDAFSSLSGDKFERILRKLLIDCKHISVQTPEMNKPEILTYDLANEVFCGDVQDMFLLCFEVIRLNYSGFFKKLGTQFGNLQNLFRKKAPRITESST